MSSLKSAESPRRIFFINIFSYKFNRHLSNIIILLLLLLFKIVTLLRSNYVWLQRFSTETRGTHVFSLRAFWLTHPPNPFTKIQPLMRGRECFCIQNWDNYIGSDYKKHKRGKEQPPHRSTFIPYSLLSLPQNAHYHSPSFQSKRNLSSLAMLDILWSIFKNREEHMNVCYVHFTKEPDS